MILGVDVGGTKVLAVPVAADGTTGPATRTATPDDLPGLLATLRALLADEPGARALGLGVPGAIAPDGRVVHCPNLPALVGVTVDTIADGLGVPVAIDNDANCAALAEARLGGHAGADDLLLVTLGTGIGGGIVRDGAVLHGAHGWGGEVGHLLVEPGGRPCPCGQRGCWERYASGTALTELAGTVPGLPDGPGRPGARLLAAATAGHAEARTAVAGWIGWLAAGLVTLQSVLDPAVTVLGGGVVEEAAHFLPALRDAVAAGWSGTALVGPPQLVAARLGPEAGAVGAALLAADTVA